MNINKKFVILALAGLMIASMIVPTALFGAASNRQNARAGVDAGRQAWLSVVDLVRCTSKGAAKQFVQECENGTFSSMYDCAWDAISFNNQAPKRMRDSVIVSAYKMVEQQLCKRIKENARIEHIEEQKRIQERIQAVVKAGFPVLQRDDVGADFITWSKGSTIPGRSVSSAEGDDWLATYVEKCANTLVDSSGKADKAGRECLRNLVENYTDEQINDARDWAYMWVNRASREGWPDKFQKSWALTLEVLTKEHKRRIPKKCVA